MSDERDDLEEIHKHSTNHRDSVEKPDAVIGCFYCLTLFSLNGMKFAERGSGRCFLDGPKELEWIDGGETLLCPFCGIDAILSTADVWPITKKMLKEMYSYWFRVPE